MLPDTGGKHDMRILVYGAGKTGTTAVFYAYKSAIPGMTEFFEPADLSKIEIAKSPNLLVKSLAVMKHAQDAQHFQHFDKKVLILRHPFDRLVSYVLYAPNNGHGFFDDRNMDRYLTLLRRKLDAPGSIPFRQIVEMVDEYQPTAAGMHAPMKALEAIANNYPDFHLLRYEDFVDGNLDELSRYSGVVLQGNPEIGERQLKVVRSKDYGDWHKWFLPEDVNYFGGIYRTYLDRFGYDTALRDADALNEATTTSYAIKVANHGRRIRWLPEYVRGEINMTTEGLQYQAAKQAFITGDLPQAEQLVNTAIAADPRIAGLHHLRSQVLTRRGDHAGAAEALQQAIALMPQEPRFHELLSVAFRRMGNKADAAAAASNAKDLQQTTSD
jgi:tetratricopeptide (TPR) repeat protein